MLIGICVILIPSCSGFDRKLYDFDKKLYDYVRGFQHGVEVRRAVSDKLNLFYSFGQLALVPMLGSALSGSHRSCIMFYQAS